MTTADFALQHGWPVHVGEAYENMLGNQSVPWGDLTGLDGASFWLASVVRTYSQLPSFPQLRIISRLLTASSIDFDFPKYCRELLQNSIDTADEDSTLEIKLIVKRDKVIWIHNGRPFSGPRGMGQHGEMGSLFSPGATTKSGKFDQEGKFGVGFKGWTEFFKKISIECFDNDRDQYAKIGWEISGQRIVEPVYHFDTGWSLKSESNPFGEQQFTKYTFSKIKESYENVTIKQIVDELLPMVRFAKRNLRFEISGDFLDRGEKVVINHDIELIEDHANEYPSYSVMRISNGTLVEYDVHECEKSETLLCVQSGIRTPTDATQDEDPIYQAVKAYIEEQSEFWGDEEEEHNPWTDIEPSNWYRDKRVTMAIAVEEEWGSEFEEFIAHLCDVEEEDVDEEKVTWLHSLAPIHRAEGWPTSELTRRLSEPDQNLWYNTSWCIDAPFFLDTDRVVMDADHKRANAQLLSIILNQCAGHLSRTILSQNFNKHKLLTMNVPFDALIYEGALNPSLNPFHEILFDHGPPYGQDSGWGNGVRPKDYSSLFGNRPFFVNIDNEPIDFDEIRIIPGDWRIGGENAVTVIEWLEAQDIEILRENWADIPGYSIGDTVMFLHEGNAQLTRLIPKLTEDEMYQKIVDAGLIDQLKQDYPQVTNAVWFRPPTPEGINAIICDAVAPTNPVIITLWNACAQSGVLFNPDDDLQDVYRSDKNDWVQDRGMWTITAPEVMGESFEWWANRLIEILNHLGCHLIDDDIEAIAEGLNNSDSDWFVASCHSIDVSGVGVLRRQMGPAIIKKNLGQQGEWTLLMESLTGWRRAAGGDAQGAGLWRTLPDSYQKISHIDKVHFNRELGNLRAIGEKNISIIAGQPVNPRHITNIIENIAECYAIGNPGNNEGAVLIAYPSPCSDELRDQLQNWAWTKIPNIALARGDVCTMSDSGVWGVARQWNTLGNNLGDLRDYYDTLYGHCLRLNTQNSRWNHHRYHALIRELSIATIASTNEFLGNPAIGIDRETDLIRKIHSERLTGDGSRMTIQLVRTHKGNVMSGYSLRRASVRTIRMGAAMYDQQQIIQQGQLYDLREEGLCGFFEDEVQDELVSWLPYPAEDDDELLRELVTDLEHIRDPIMFTSEMDIVISILPENEDVRTGLSEGVKILLEQVVDTEEHEILCAFARLMGRISILMGSEREDPEIVFDNMREQQINIDGEIQTSATEIFEQGLLDEEDEETHEMLQAVLHGIQGLAALSWEAINRRILNSIESGEPAQTQWEIFDEGGYVPDRSGHRYRNDTSLFELSPGLARINPQVSFIDVANAQRLFHITLEETHEDATGWIIPHNQRWVSIIRDDINNLLEAEGAINRVYGRWNSAGIWARVTAEEQDDDRVEIHTKWSYVQALIGLHLAKQNDRLDEDIQGIMPSVSSDVISHRCQIFNPNGPEIRIGRFGWDLRIIDNENRPTIEENGTLNLANSNPDGGERHSRRNLLRLLIGIGLSGERRLSLIEDEGCQQLADLMEIDVEIITTFRDQLRNQGADLLNPFIETEREQWRRYHEPAPDCSEHLDESRSEEGAGRLLGLYHDAIQTLIRREEMGPIVGDTTQELIIGLWAGAINLREMLYPNGGSLIAEEPLINIPNDTYEGMHKSRRNQSHYSTRYRLLNKMEDGVDFIGNILWLTPYTQHRSSMTAHEFGLKERMGHSIPNAVRALIENGQWGPDDYIILRNVMQIGEENHVSLRLHKYHAILMAAMDEALDEMEQEVMEIE